MAREFAKKFYKSKEWQGVRGNVLRRDNYLCRHCGNPAEEVHHIIHLKPDNISNPMIALHEDNLLSLCTDCHFKVHREDIKQKVIKTNKSRRKPEVRDGYMFDNEGNIIPITGNVYIVYGSPGSGKTTYVKEHMEIGDMVVDLDLIKQAISLQGRTDKTDNLLNVTLTIRDLLYKMIEHREVDSKNIWVVAGLPNKTQRIDLKNRLKAELIYIDTPIHECIKRVRNDSTRMDKQQQIDIINQWWNTYQA